jgi:hypothetical protein
MRKSRQIRIQLVHQLTMAHCAARIDLIRRKWRICCVLPQQDTMVGSRNNGWRCRDTSRRKVIVAMAQHRGEKASTSVRQSPIRSLLLAPSVRLPPPEWGRRGWKRKGMAVQPITTKKKLMAKLSLRLPQACSELWHGPETEKECQDDLTVCCRSDGSTKSDWHKTKNQAFGV